MMVIRFKSNMEYADLIKKVKKMKQFTEDLEMCLEDAMEGEDLDFRRSYRKNYDDDDMRMESRYGYRRGM